jgi:putative ABC transport system permease protein
VSVSSHPLSPYPKDRELFVPQGFDEAQMMYQMSFDSDFIPMFGIKIVAGRNFSRNHSTDHNDAILINETAAKQFGWDNPIGKKIRALDSKNTAKIIIGVVKDFHMESLHNKIIPLYIETEPSRFQYISIKVTPENSHESMMFLQEKWTEFDPTQPVNSLFLDEFFGDKYMPEKIVFKIVSYFTFLALFIACMGLFGLASFTAEQRNKEIGIRKALGASLAEIILLLSKEFTKWVFLANIIAWPVAYFAMNQWLKNFAYRINIGLGPFVLAGVLALIIALLTVGYQAVKAARVNPVVALRYE